MTRNTQGRDAGSALGRMPREEWAKSYLLRVTEPWPGFLRDQLTGTRNGVWEERLSKAGTSPSVI